VPGTRPGTGYVLSHPIINGSRPRSSILGPLDKAAVGGADDDAGAGLDIGRDHHPAAVFEAPRLVGGGGGLAAHHRIGLDQLHRDARRHLDRQRRPLMQHDLADHAVAQEIGRLADQFARHADLLEIVVVHEGRLVALHIEELHVLLVEADALGGFLPVGKQRGKRNAPGMGVRMTGPWWRPDRLAERRAKLETRGHVLQAVREFFAEAGFVEVDTPTLQVSPGLEPHLKAFATVLHDPRDGGARPRYLQTSPEFAMKKLLAGGMTRVWQLAHVYRDSERSATH